MPSTIRKTAVTTPVPIEIRVCSADCESLSDGDLRRLFAGSALTEGRLDRLRAWPRVAVLVGGSVAATATCQKVEIELRVPDVGVDGSLPHFGGASMRSDRDVVNALLDAIEMAALAAGCQRIVMNPPRTSLGLLERRGYHPVRESCAGAWIEKLVGC